MKEKDLEKRVCDWAAAREVINIKLNTLGAYGTSGWPDRIFLYKGQRPVFIEFKQKGKKLTPLQVKKITELTLAGYEKVDCCFNS